MCRSIKTLYNLEPPTGEEEIRAAALQYVRKISGFREPSQANRAAYRAAVEEITAASSRLLAALVTDAAPRDRAALAARARDRAARRDPGGTDHPPA